MVSASVSPVPLFRTRKKTTPPMMTRANTSPTLTSVRIVVPR
jgi:hypothetical protein